VGLIGINIRGDLLKEGSICCFPLEVKVRDLDPRLYLAVKFVNEGFPSLIGSKTGVHDYIYSQKSKYIYFDKGLTGTDGEFCNTLIQHGAVIVSLDEEGGVFNKGYKNLLIRYNDSTLKYRALVCAWGEKQKDIILKNSDYITEDTIVVTGHPRFDLRKPSWAPFYEKLRKVGASQQYILFNLAFGLYNNQMSRSTFESWFKKVNPHCDFDEFISHNTKLEEYQKQLFEEFIDIIKLISKKFKSLTIVVRPHPAEKIEVYIKIFKNYRNVKVSREGSAQEWIIGALLVIHHDCTTAIESFFFGKEILSYCPVFDEDLVQEVPVKLSQVVSDSNDIVNIIKRRIDGQTFSSNQEDLSIRKDILKQIIANIDFDSTDKIIKAVIDRVETFEFAQRDAALYRKVELKEKIVRKAYLFKKNTLKYFYGANSSDIVSKKKFPGLSKNEIAKRIKYFAEIEPACSGISVKKVNPDTFLLYKKVQT